MDGYVTIGTELDTKSFDAQIDYVKGQLDEIEYKLKQADMGFEVGDVQKLEADYEKLSSKLSTLIQKKQQFNNVEVKRDFTQLKKSVDDVGKGLTKVTKKAKQWALAIFGVRSAYMLIRNAMNVLTEGDEQLKADLDYIKVALASALEPIIRGIVDLVKRLLMYIGYIINAWTGINIFENANENLEKANGSAKELKKTVTGFDEMNVLQDDKSKGNVAPSFDLEGLGDGEIPDWIQWIADHGKEVTEIIAGITGAVIALKLGFKGLQALGIGIAIYGILEFIEDLLDFIKDPSWEGFIKVIADIGIAIGGLMLLFGNWQGLIIAGIALLVKLVVEHWDEIAKVLGGIGDWIKSHVIDPIADFFTGLWDKVKNAFSSTWEFIKNAFSKGGKIFNGLKEGIVSTFKTVVNTLITGINKVIKIPFEKINGLLNTIRNINILGVKPFKGLWSKNPLPVPKIPKLAIGGIVNMPGRGVMVGNAIAGERGAEGVIPLTNSQQMELIGQAIGKYVTINANITNSMNGRVISRELQKIQNENNFAFNR